MKPGNSTYLARIGPDTTRVHQMTQNGKFGATQVTLRIKEQPCLGNAIQHMTDTVVMI